VSDRRAPGHYGAAATGAAFSEATIAGAWNLQCRQPNPALAETVARLFRVELPITPNTTRRTDALSVLWLGPNSWLLASGGTSALQDFTARRDAINAAAGALFDVSAGRVAWTLRGPQAAAVLAKGCPLDFHLRAFPLDACAQSVFGHINVLLARQAADAFTVLVARSFAKDLWHEMTTAAAQYGYEVLPPAPFRG
jgi:sarcosine oxidase subunit gamma